MRTLLAQAASFDQHVSAILQEFQNEYAWLDKEKSSLAIFIVDALAGIAEVGQTHLMFALRESFIRKARRDSSVLAGVKFLGVDFPRKSGSSVLCTLRNNSESTTSIAPFSALQISGFNFYSDSGITILPRSNLNVTLKQGIIEQKVIDLSSLDLEFPELVLGIPDFVVSGEDLIIKSVSANGEEIYWTKHLDTLYEMRPTDSKYIESTTAEGDVNLLFGNGEYGRRLPADGELHIQYVRVSGSASNIGSPDSRITIAGNSFISGVTIEAAAGGSDQKDTNFFKLYAPHLFESRRSLVRQDHWEANILNYPDVADVTIQGQRDIDPADPAWQSTVRVCILPKNSSSWGGANPNPTSGQWNRFKKWIETVKPKHITIAPYNPEKEMIDILIEYYVFDDVDASKIEPILTVAVQKFFARQQGILGRSLELSDLEDLIKYDAATGERRDEIDYVRILSPEKSVHPKSKLNYITPRSIKLIPRYSTRKRK